MGELVHVDFGAAWRTSLVPSLGRFDVADNRIHDAPHRQQLLALRGVQVLDSLSRQECPHEPVQAWEAEHHFVVCALGAEGVSFNGLGLGHTVIPILLLDTRRKRARIGHPGGHCPVYYQPSPADRWLGPERMFSAFGCLVYRYRLIVVAIWAIVVLVAGPIATRVFQVLGADGFSSSELEAARADAVLTQRFGFDPGTLLVVYEDPQGQLLATDPRF